VIWSFPVSASPPFHSLRIIIFMAGGASSSMLESCRRRHDEGSVQRTAGYSILSSKNQVCIVDNSQVGTPFFAFSCLMISPSVSNDYLSQRIPFRNLFGSKSFWHFGVVLFSWLPLLPFGNIWSNKEGEMHLLTVIDISTLRSPTS